MSKCNIQLIEQVANPAVAVKVKMNGAFSANLDSPVQFCFSVTKAGKPQGCLPASLDFGDGEPPQLRDTLSHQRGT